MSVEDGRNECNARTVNTREVIRGFVSETFFVDQFGDGDSFLQSGIIDSTGMLELVAFIEQKFGLKLADTELVPKNLDSLDNLCAFLERKSSGA